jgi:hypothetical protein
MSARSSTGIVIECHQAGGPTPRRPMPEEAATSRSTPRLMKSSANDW